MKVPAIKFKMLLMMLALGFASCQKETSLQENFKNHINYLASDELEGREAGTPAEATAAAYLSEMFENYKLSPMGTSGYVQEFNFLLGKIVENNSLTLDGQQISLDETPYFPVNYSGSQSVSGDIMDIGFGIEAEELNYSDYIGHSPEGKIAVMKISSPDGIHPHSKYIKFHSLRDRVKLAESKGAVGIILVNNDNTTSNPNPDYTEKMMAVGIPVIFVEDFELVQGKEMAEINVQLTEDNRTAQNVIGYIDNGSETTVIIGAHFDHLGYGENGGSLYRGERKIHNGADDNASGTSMLIEISGAIAKSDLKEMNYLFIAFSGEEKGLLGANYFTKNPTIDLEKVSYMINMDMVGRLDTTDYALAINGVGTSPVWDSLIAEIDSSPLDIKTTQSGVGPSDHTAFYLSDIPVLHFFTGTHEDYHKPSDDFDKINFEGMEKVFDLIMEINYSLGNAGKIEFTKTQDDQGRSVPRFNVTFGIIPDYMYEDAGLRIDGVTGGKPAEIAGIEKNDIIVRIGEWEIDDIYSYMETLGKLKKGDKTEVEVIRGDERLVLEIQL